MNKKEWQKRHQEGVDRWQQELKRQSAERLKHKVKETTLYMGDNFCFVCWGGLEDLKVWRRAELEIGEGW